MPTKMLCASACTRFLPSFSLLSPQPLFRRRNCLIHRHNHQTPITMSAQHQIVEHVVLFKVKPDVDSSKVAAMVNGLNALTSLNLTVHLSAGQLLQTRSSSLTFTHMLHSRYRSVDDLKEYAAHPEHVRVVTENIKPIIDDIMAVDWISDDASVSPKPGSAVRVTFLKLKDESEKSRVLEVIRGIKDEFPAIEQLSVGENFSHDRAKGYTIASVAVLPGTADLEALDSNEELVKLQKEKVRDSIESVVVVDYVVPPPQSANL
ncbi:stress-response A/B barrel domain-containing protein UP3-like [Bidens hawaiensis]|uniref:stress-response A/B barrel domain-containing protein UP3-like n=1 Tax=Bidens hawaiensis TaxID=980011 RepID=UPI00404A6934